MFDSTLSPVKTVSSLVREREPPKKTGSSFLPVLTLKQLSKCQPWVSPSPKKVRTFSFCGRPWTPLIAFTNGIWGCCTSAELKCAILCGFHSKPWMAGRGISKNVQLGFPKMPYLSNRNSNRNKHPARTASAPIYAPFTCCPSAPGCKQNGCGSWLVCSVSKWSCHLRTGEEEEECVSHTQCWGFKTCTKFDVQHVLAHKAIMFHIFIIFGGALGYWSISFMRRKCEEVSCKRAIMFHCIVEIKSPCPQEPQGGP